MSAKGTTTAVEIFGSVYYVRGDNDTESLRQLAGMVDAKMREIAKHVTTVDTAKIAILAALNLADELSKAKDQQQGERVELREKVEALTAQLEQSLQE